MTKEMTMTHEKITAKEIRSRARRHLVLLGATIATCAAVLGASASLALASGPAWEINARWGPTNLPPGGTGEVVLQPSNVGDGLSDGSTITVADQLPAGVTISSFSDTPFWQCTGVGTSTATCTMEGIFALYFNQPASLEPQPNGFGMPIFVDLSIDPGAAGVGTNTATMSGGGAEPVTQTREMVVSDTAAGFGFVPNSFDADVFDAQAPNGSPTRQAGDHPFEMRVNFDFNLLHGEREGGYTYPDELVRTVDTTLPRGLIGNPEALPKCTAGEFSSVGEAGGCPADTQVGVIGLDFTDGASSHGFGPFLPGAFQRIPVYNLVPPKGSPADFGFLVAGVVSGHILPSLDAAHSYAIEAITPNISSLSFIRDVKFTLWGVPADPAHDRLRLDPATNNRGAVSDGAIRPFLTLPMDCGNGDRFAQRADSWQHPGAWTPVVSAPDEQIEVKGCSDPRIRFGPEVRMQPTTRDAGAPTGLDVHLEVPQRDQTVSDASKLYSENGNVHGVDTPPMKKVVVTMPEGMTISPSAAQGLGNCSPEQIGLGTDSKVTCPDDSQYGTLTLHTPILPKDEPMTGRIYIAEQNDNPFHSFLALYLVIQDPERGLLVKIPGKVELDPKTGQIKTAFDDLPQFPVSDMELSFKAGVRAALVNPTTCGSKTITAEFTPWSDPTGPVVQTDEYAVTQKPDGSPCVKDLAERPFNPQLTAGTINPSAGSYSPFVLRLTRTDDDQEFSRLGVNLPDGLLARIAGIQKCPDAAIAQAEAPLRTGTEELDNPSCPASSQIGTTDVGTGVGVPLTYVPGKAYLAGPYEGAPLSMVVITPALVGPYDLGVIAVRSAIHVDPETAQTSVSTDPLPQIFQGIPVRIRDIRVKVDRPETTLNPTSCNPMEVTAHVAGTGGDVNASGDDTVADLSQRFQAANCASLRFKPRLSFRLRGGTNRGDYPALTATVKARRGDANIARAAVTLPHSEFLAQNHINTVCTRVQFAANQCPTGSIYGYARATSPLFDEVLKGPVYLRSSSNPLPDLVATLNGAVDVVLSGRIDSVNGGIRNTFEAVPDAPVTKFTLSMKGGKKGLLVNSRNLCKGRNYADVRMVGQNGKLSKSHPLVANSCADAGKRAR
jgi:hypothetical protein